MAKSNVRPPPGPIPIGVAKKWDEGQLDQGLLRLKELYIKLRDLRSAIPVFKQMSTPEAAFAEFTTSVIKSHDELLDFKQFLTSEATTKVLEHAKQSRQAKPKGIKPWRASDHPDWYQMNS